MVFPILISYHGIEDGLWINLCHPHCPPFYYSLTQICRNGILASKGLNILNRHPLLHLSLLWLRFEGRERQPVALALACPSLLLSVRSESPAQPACSRPNLLCPPSQSRCGCHSSLKQDVGSRCGALDWESGNLWPSSINATRAPSLHLERKIVTPQGRRPGMCTHCSVPKPAVLSLCLAGHECWAGHQAALRPDEQTQEEEKHSPFFHLKKGGSLAQCSHQAGDLKCD